MTGTATGTAGRRCRGDGGTGMLSTMAGIMVFLVFLLFAVQLLVGLYGRTVVTSAAYDGARYVARQPVDQRARAQGEAKARIVAQLGAIGAQPSTVITFTGSDDDVIRLQIEADNPRFLSPTIAGPLATDHISREVTVRVERPR